MKTRIHVYFGRNQKFFHTSTIEIIGDVWDEYLILHSLEIDPVDDLADMLDRLGEVRIYAPSACVYGEVPAKILGLLTRDITDRQTVPGNPARSYVIENETIITGVVVQGRDGSITRIHF